MHGWLGWHCSSRELVGHLRTECKGARGGLQGNSQEICHRLIEKRQPETIAGVNYGSQHWIIYLMNRKQLARVSHVSWEPHMITCHELYNAISGMWRHWEWDVMCNEAITSCVASWGWHSIRAEWSPATHLKLNVMIEWWVHYLLL